MAGVAEDEAGIEDAVVVVEEDAAGIEEGGAEAVAGSEEGATGVEEEAIVIEEGVAMVAEDGAEIKECVVVVEVDVGGVSKLGETGRVVEDTVGGLRDDSGGRAGECRVSVGSVEGRRPMWPGDLVWK